MLKIVLSVIKINFSQAYILLFLGPNVLHKKYYIAMHKAPAKTPDM
jgi:hypothetical protein